MEFNPEKHYLGKLCLHGHDYQGTGKSVRTKRSKHGCCACAARYNKKYIKSDKGIKMLKRIRAQPEHKAKSRAYYKKHMAMPGNKERKARVEKERCSLPEVKAKRLETNKAWRKTDKGRAATKIYTKMYYQKKAVKERERARILNLDDGYVIHALCKHSNLNPKTVTSKMIALKRMQLKFYREIKKGKEALNEIY